MEVVVDGFDVEEDEVGDFVDLARLFVDDDAGGVECGVYVVLLA